MESLRSIHENSEFCLDGNNTFLITTEATQGLAATSEYAKRNELSPKNEFHCTVIGTRTAVEISEILSGLDGNQGDLLLVEIDSLIKQFSWNIIPKNEFFLLEKTYPEYDGEVRRTIIQMVDIPDLTEFYEKLNNVLSSNFSLPLPHITLYATSTNEKNILRGIGVYSEDEFKQLQPKQILSEV